MLIDEMIKYHIAVIALLLGISIYGFFYLLGKEITGLKLKKRLTTRSYIIQGFLMAAGFSGWSFLRPKNFNRFKHFYHDNILYSAYDYRNKKIFQDFKS